MTLNYKGYGIDRDSIPVAGEFALPALAGDPPATGTKCRLKMRFAGSSRTRLKSARFVRTVVVDNHVDHAPEWKWIFRRGGT